MTRCETAPRARENALEATRFHVHAAGAILLLLARAAVGRPVEKAETDQCGENQRGEK